MANPLPEKDNAVPSEGMMPTLYIGQSSPFAVSSGAVVLGTVVFHATLTALFVAALCTYVPCGAQLAYFPATMRVKTVPAAIDNLLGGAIVRCHNCGAASEVLAQPTLRTRHG